MGGTPYYTALRLVSIAQEHWGTIDGEAAQRGVNYFELSFDRWLNVIHYWSAQRVRDPEEFERELARPIGAKVAEVDLETDARSFMAFASAMGVRVPTPSAEIPSGSSAEG